MMTFDTGDLPQVLTLSCFLLIHGVLYAGVDFCMIIMLVNHPSSSTQPVTEPPMGSGRSWWLISESSLMALLVSSSLGGPACRS